MAITPRSIDAGVRIGEIFVDKYRVDAILGHGGMGVVALCTHLALHERVAIKMLRRDVLDDHDAVERFMREAQAAVKLKSEFVARVSDVGRSPANVPYMVMEYLEGKDLGDLLDERGHLGLPWAVELTLQACEALAEAHSLHIVHRDIKPTNLFVTWRPDGSTLLKVLDFGISKALTGKPIALTQTQSLLGTPAYMSPEQMRSARNVDARTDIWSLGTVLYEMLEGRRPFEAESFSEMCVKVAVDPPAAMANTPLALQDVVLRCLEKGPEQRYQSMAEFARALVPFSHDPHQATVLTERMARTLRRSGTRAAVLNPSSSPSGPVRASGERPAATPPRGPAATPPHSSAASGPAATPPHSSAASGPAATPLRSPAASGPAIPAAGSAAIPAAGSAAVPAAGSAAVPAGGSAAGFAAVPAAGSAAVPTSPAAVAGSASAISAATPVTAVPGEARTDSPALLTGRRDSARSSAVRGPASSISQTMAVVRPRRHTAILLAAILTAAAAVGVAISIIRQPSAREPQNNINDVPQPRESAAPAPAPKTTLDHRTSDSAAVPASPAAAPTTTTDSAAPADRTAGSSDSAARGSDPAAPADRRSTTDPAASTDHSTDAGRPDQRSTSGTSRAPGATKSTTHDRRSGGATGTTKPPPGNRLIDLSAPPQATQPGAGSDDCAFAGPHSTSCGGSGSAGPK